MALPQDNPFRIGKYGSSSVCNYCNHHQRHHRHQNIAVITIITTTITSRTYEYHISTIRIIISISAYHHIKSSYHISPYHHHTISASFHNHYHHVTARSHNIIIIIPLIFIMLWQDHLGRICCHI